MKLLITDKSGKIVDTLKLEKGFTYQLLLECGETVPKLRTLPTFKNPKVLSIVLAALAVLSCAFHYSFDPYTKDKLDIFKNILSIGLVLIGAIVLLSVVTKVISGKFKINHCINLVLISLLGSSLIDENLFGIRWLMPRMFWVREVYALFYYILVAFVLYFLGRILFENLKVKVLLPIVGVLMLLALVFNYVDYLPTKDEYKYFRPDISPPLLWESRTVSVDGFLDKINK